jgi:DNA-directed RNA polymerase subunit H (RpoH/RPB5)
MKLTEELEKKLKEYNSKTTDYRPKQEKICEIIVNMTIEHFKLPIVKNDDEVVRYIGNLIKQTGYSTHRILYRKIINILRRKLLGRLIGGF